MRFIPGTLIGNADGISRFIPPRLTPGERRPFSETSGMPFARVYRETAHRPTRAAARNIRCRMIQDVTTLYDQLRTRAETYGVRTREAAFGPETAGTFDGLSVTMNEHYDPVERCFYLAHALGSIAQWGRDPKHAQAVFDELRAAKRAKDPG